MISLYVVLYFQRLVFRYYAPINVLPHLPHAGKRGVKPGDYTKILSPR